MNFDISTAEGMVNSLRWTERHVNRIANGGTWLVPRSGSIYQLFKDEKRVVVLAQLSPDPSIDKVFAAMGWTVERGRP